MSLVGTNWYNANGLVIMSGDEQFTAGKKLLKDFWEYTEKHYEQIKTDASPRPVYITADPVAFVESQRLFDLFVAHSIAQKGHRSQSPSANMRFFTDVERLSFSQPTAYSVATVPVYDLYCIGETYDNMEFVVDAQRRFAEAYPDVPVNWIVESTFPGKGKDECYALSGTFLVYDLAKAVGAPNATQISFRRRSGQQYRVRVNGAKDQTNYGYLFLLGDNAPLMYKPNPRTQTVRREYRHFWGELSMRVINSAQDK